MEELAHGGGTILSTVYIGGLGSIAHEGKGPSVHMKDEKEFTCLLPYELIVLLAWKCMHAWDHHAQNYYASF